MSNLKKIPALSTIFTSNLDLIKKEIKGDLRMRSYSYIKNLIKDLDIFLTEDELLSLEHIKKLDINCIRC